MTRQVTHQPSDLAYLSTHSALPVVSAMLVRGAVTWSKWRLRRKTRLHLKHLDAHLLKDVGLENYAAHQEAIKPFWRP